MDLALKQRLVGASVLIALAVIFLPLLFDETNGEINQSINIEIPQEPIDLKRKIIAIDGNNQGQIEQKQELKEVIVAKPLVKKEETVVEIVDNSLEQQEVIIKPLKQKPTVQETVKSVVKVKPKIKQPAKIKSKQTEITEADEKNSYRIKIGVFSQIKNAQKIKAELIHNNIDSLVEKDSATGLYKVYAKQNSSLSQTKALNAKIQKLKLNIGKTSIETLDKSASDDVQMLLDTGWIVQIGIFSNQINSLKLRDKIRNKKFVCFVDSILNASNKAMYRVRVGPFATRDEAIVEQNKIKKIMNLKGLVKPHEKQKVVS